MFSEIIRFTQHNLCCVSKSTMKHLKYDLSLSNCGCLLFFKLDTMVYTVECNILLSVWC